MSFKDEKRESASVITRDSYLNGLTLGLGGLVSVLVNACVGKQIFKPIDTSEYASSTQYPGRRRKYRYENDTANYHFGGALTTFFALLFLVPGWWAVGIAATGAVFSISMNAVRNARLNWAIEAAKVNTKAI